MLPRGLAGIHSPLRFCLCFLAMKKPHLTPIKAPRVGSQGHMGPHPSSHFTPVCLSAGGPAPVPGRRLGGATLLLCSALGSPTLGSQDLHGAWLKEGRKEGCRPLCKSCWNKRSAIYHLLNIYQGQGLYTFSCFCDIPIKGVWVSHFAKLVILPDISAQQ